MPVLFIPPHRTLSRMLNEAVQHLKSLDPSFIASSGRVKRDFDGNGDGRLRQAEQILRSLRAWPPEEGRLYAIQIDQDSPPPPPPLPPPAQRWIKGALSPSFLEWQKGRETLSRYLARYTGKTMLMKAEKKNGSLQLTELRPEGPYVSASHPAQIDPMGQASCNGPGICGLPWLRNGIYAYVGAGPVFNPVADKATKVARDLNADGAVDSRESLLSSEAHGFTIQFHAGFPGAPRSAGCQTMPPADFEDFRRRVNREGGAFTYVLVRRPNDLTGAYVW